MSYLRPDEAANRAEIERDKNFRPTAITNKVLPFLSPYIPAGLALQGINKVAPKIGAFLKRGQDAGLDIKEGLNFVRDKITPAKENRNIIEMESPELHQFIQQEMQRGKSPLEAGAVAEFTNPAFKKIISKLSKDHKTDWSAILQTVYGGAQQAQQPQQAQPQQQMQGQPQPSQNNAALLSILQQLKQARGG